MTTGGEMHEGPGEQGPGGGPGYGGGPGETGGGPTYGGGYGGYGGGPGYGGGGGYGGGWGRGGWGRGGWGMGMMGMMGPRPRPNYPIETKPFFLTSEFALTAIAWFGMLITTLANDHFNARQFWTLTTILLAFYMLSRGIAKSGTQSMSWDPREDPNLLRGGGGASEEPTQHN